MLLSHMSQTMYHHVLNQICSQIVQELLLSLALNTRQFTNIEQTTSYKNNAQNTKQDMHNNNSISRSLLFQGKD